MPPERRFPEPPPRLLPKLIPYALIIGILVAIGAYQGITQTGIEGKHWGMAFVGLFYGFPLIFLAPIFYFVDRGRKSAWKTTVGRWAEKEAERQAAEAEARRLGSYPKPGQTMEEIKARIRAIVDAGTYSPPPSR